MAEHTEQETIGDVVFNNTINIWQCCGNNANNVVQCQNPTDVTFEAPAPSLLSSIGPIQSSSTAPTIVTVTQTLTAAAVPAATTASDTVHQSGVPREELSGIVIGSIVGAVIITSAIFAIASRWRARRADAACDAGTLSRGNGQPLRGTELPDRNSGIIAEADSDPVYNVREMP